MSARRYRGRRRARDEDLHDEGFAALAPSYDAFPGFVTRDFAAFEKQKQRSAAHNAERLVVKRKLAGLVKDIEPALREAGLKLRGRTSLSHPYNHNGWRVASLWAYFGRSDAQKNKLKRTLGADLGKDVDPAYQGAILLVEIDEQRVAHGLKVHPAAWWDGRQLLKRLDDAGEAAELLATLRGLPEGFAVGIGGWRRRRPCRELGPATLQHALSFYKPGEHWLEVLSEIPRAEAVERGPDLAGDLAAGLAALGPLWRMVAWDGG
jgi:hypothetical protein